MLRAGPKRDRLSVRLLRDRSGVGPLGVFVGALVFTLVANVVWDVYESGAAKAGQTLRAWVPPAADGRDYRREIEQGARRAGVVLNTPVRYSHVSSEFSHARRHPITGKVTPHLGTDFAAPHGTEIWSAAAGRVTFAGTQGGDGQMVMIDHGGGFTTSYSHMSGFARGLRVGDWVGERQVIGYVGSSGSATGPHLHFAVQYYNQFIDFNKLARAW
jgi:murein DD-endopeptidase MepM/ murein hydrolase activator NlpD